MILGKAEAAKYGERGQEAGVYLLYDQLEGEKPVGRLTNQEKRAVESSLLIKVDDQKKSLQVSLDLPSTKIVKVQVLDRENEVVRQLVNAWKWAGPKEFKWNFEDADQGKYKLKIEVGELVLLRDIEL